MRLISLLLLSITLLFGCAANKTAEVTAKDYQFRFIGKTEGSDKRIEKIKEYIEKEKPDFWRNLTDNEKLIWLDYALYSADKYGYGYGEKLYSYIDFTKKLGAAFMDDKDVEENVRRFLRDDRFNDFVRLRDGFRYLVKKGVEDRLPSGLDIEKILKVSLNQPKYKKKKRGKVKPVITMASNNSSEGSVFIDVVTLDEKYGGGGTGIHGCGSGLNGGGRSSTLSTPPPMKSIYIKWYSWTEKSNIEAKVMLPKEKIMESLYYFPPWYDPEFDSRPDSTIIIDIRPQNRVWIKLAKGLYPKSQQEIMIIGEGIGQKTEEVVTDFIHYVEGEDYKLDCFERRKQGLKSEEGSELYDSWYPGARQNKDG